MSTRISLRLAKYILSYRILSEVIEIKTIFKTFAVVTTMSVAERFIGFLYRIVLSRALGSEGLGIYQIALSVFGVFVTMTSSGIPLTVSRLMQKYRAENQPKKLRSAISAGLTVALAVSVPVVLLFVFCGNWFSFAFADPRSLSVFTVLVPGLIFTSVYAVLRGVFWGNKDFVPYSIIELIEEIVMVVCGVLLVTRATDAATGATRAALAVVLSYAVSFSLATLTFFLKGGKLSSPKSELRPLLSSALPITGMRTANSVVSSLIAVLLPQQLVRAGMTASEALSAFGAAYGMAVPLLFIPSSIIGSLALILVPELSANFYAGNTKKLKSNVEKAVRASVLIAGLIVPVFFSMGKEIGITIYGSEAAGRYLAAASPVMFPMCLMMISQSLLNSMGKEKRTLLHYLLGAAVMLVCVLIGPFFLGAHALSVGFFASYTLTAALNFRLLFSCCPTDGFARFVRRCVLLSLPCAALGFALKRVLQMLVAPIANCMIGCTLVAAFTVCAYLVTNTVNPKQVLTAFQISTHRKKRAGTLKKQTAK